MDYWQGGVRTFYGTDRRRACVKNPLPPVNSSTNIWTVRRVLIGNRSVFGTPRDDDGNFYPTDSVCLARVVFDDVVTRVSRSLGTT